MLDLNNIKDVYLYSKEIDMRMGMYTIQKVLNVSFSPIEILDSMFIFVSRNRKALKIYYENEYGTWLLINKISYFKFQVESLKAGVKLTHEDVSNLLHGVVIKSERIKQIRI